jgi:hypothetical protein
MPTQGKQKQLSAYNHFTAYNLHGQRPPPGNNLLHQQKMVQNGAQWRNLSPQEKAKWENQARLGARK